jgi:HSP20 family protein
MRRFFEDDEDELRVEEFLEDDKLVVRAELPGIDPDRDVDIDIRDHSLRIRAERRQEQRKEERGGFRSEFHYGTFTPRHPVGQRGQRERRKGNLSGRHPRGAGTDRSERGESEEDRDRTRLTTINP